MSTEDRDDDLAPVTDLFGARSSRRRASAPDSSRAVDAPAPDARSNGRDDVPDDDGREDVPDPTPSIGSAVTQHTDRVTPIGSAGRSRGDVPGDTSAAAAPSADDWRSPVIGDGTGRSARAEQAGYDEPEADARAASVFAIGDGSELDPADAPRPVEEQRAEAEQVSMRALGRKGVSTSELRKTLTARDLDDVVVEDELDRLTRVGLLDDLALATDLVDRLHDRKGLGRQGVVAELRRRGIAQEHIDRALEAAEDDGDDELARAIELATKRARQLRGLDPDTAERRLSGFLMRKGYGSGVVRIAVERGLRGGGDRPRGTVRFE